MFGSGARENGPESHLCNPARTQRMLLDDPHMIGRLSADSYSPNAPNSAMALSRSRSISRPNAREGMRVSLRPNWSPHVRCPEVCAHWRSLGASQRALFLSEGSKTFPLSIGTCWPLAATRGVIEKRQFGDMKSTLRYCLSSPIDALAKRMERTGAIIRLARRWTASHSLRRFSHRG